MGYWHPGPLPAGSWAALGAVTASSLGTGVASHASAHTKGSWVQLTAATATDINELLVSARTASSGGHSGLIDIGIGASASEVVVAANLLISGNASDVHPPFRLPINIPAGTRVAARYACSTGAQTCQVLAYGSSGGLLAAPRSDCVTYGATTADSGGTSIDPGTVAHTKGSWTQLSAASSRDHDAVLVVIGGRRNAARAGTTFLLDIGTGAAASEVVLLGDLFIGSQLGIESFGPMVYGPFVVPTIASGTRLAARMQSGTTDATDRLLDVILHGF